MQVSAACACPLRFKDPMCSVEIQRSYVQCITHRCGWQKCCQKPSAKGEWIFTQTLLKRTRICSSRHSLAFLQCLYAVQKSQTDSERYATTSGGYAYHISERILKQSCYTSCWLGVLCGSLCAERSWNRRE